MERNKVHNNSLNNSPSSSSVNVLNNSVNVLTKAEANAVNSDIEGNTLCIMDKDSSVINHTNKMVMKVMATNTIKKLHLRLHQGKRLTSISKSTSEMIFIPITTI